MQIIELLFVLILSLGISAFKIPKDQGNGVFIYNHSDGTHQKISEVQTDKQNSGHPQSSASHQRQLKKRAQYESKSHHEVPHEAMAMKHRRFADPNAGMPDIADLDRMSSMHRRNSGYKADQTGCGQGIVTALDLASASNVLSLSCTGSTTFTGGQHTYALSGDAVVYMCSYSGRYPNPCRAPEIQDAISIVQRACPNNLAGMSDDKTV